MTEDRENSGPGDGNPSLLLRSEMGVCEGYPGSSRKFPALLTREKPGYGCCVVVSLQDDPSPSPSHLLVFTPCVISSHIVPGLMCMTNRIW